MTIQLAEPMLFLQGFDQSDHSNRTPAMLRGCLVLRVTKPTKIKVISLTFQGKATTEWPEGNYHRNPRFRNNDGGELADILENSRHPAKEVGVSGREGNYETHMAVLQCSVRNRRDRSLCGFLPSLQELQ